MESLSLLIMACDLNYIKPEKLNHIRPMIEEISNKLNALRETQLKR